MDTAFSQLNSCAKLDLFLLTLLVFASVTSICSADRDRNQTACFKHERQALLSFKRGLIDDNNSLMSWVSRDENCCEWDGIVCDNFTGHVTELNLVNDFRLSGKISPSLLNLTHLSRLSLGCYFWEDTCGLYVESLEWLSRLSSLQFVDMTHVDLSRASDHWLLATNKLSSLLELHFSNCKLGHIHPLPYVNFSSLRVLDISFNSFGASLPDWIFRLGKLVNLNIRQSSFLGPFPNGSWSSNSLRSLVAENNYFSSNIPSYLLGFPKLMQLDLSGNYLLGNVPSSIGNLTSIVSLDFSYNAFEGELPISIGNLHNLEFLYLSVNRFSGPIPESLGNMSALKELIIFRNRFSGSFPRSLGSLYNLVSLSAFENHLEGVVSEAHFANLTSLTFFFASHNSLSLRVRPDWIPPPKLDFIHMGSWDLGSDQFPTWLKSKKQLRSIDLSDTGISGIIPSWFQQTSNYFYHIDFCNNGLYGELPILPVDGSSILLFCSNKFNGTVPREFFVVSELNLSNNSLSGDLSLALCHPKASRTRLSILYLGANHFSGKIPDCWNESRLLKVLDLSNLDLSGEIPSSMQTLLHLESLSLRNNSLYGEIPFFLQDFIMLQKLDLSLNKFVGNIPNWLGLKLSYLTVLSIRSNELNGQIPNELCHLTRLQILDIADNNLSEHIPSCFDNFTSMATKRTSSEAVSYSYLETFLENAFVVTKGREDEYETILPLVTSLDLSRNNLSGQIPIQLTSLQGLISLNLSRNNLRGSIPKSIGDLSWILSLDVSSNRLSGKIPSSMSSLNFLSYLNMSYNYLSGPIPSSTQLQSLDPSSFAGNPLLCGPPLSKACIEGTKPATTGDTKNHEGQSEIDRDGEEYWFRLGIGMGFGVGFAGVVILLVLSRFWRRAYFWFIEEYIWYNILNCFIKFKHTIAITKTTHL